MLAGWLAGRPIPLLTFFAPNWWWIIAANVFLGVNHAFTWTMTVTSRVDLAGSHERGLAVGINAAAGYLAVGLAGLGSGCLAALYGPRWALLGFGLAVIAVALALMAGMRDTMAWVRAEHAQADAAAGAADPVPHRGGVSLLVSLRDRTYRALRQGGVADWGGGVVAAMWVTAALVKRSGLWIAHTVEESRPRGPLRSSSLPVSP